METRSSNPPRRRKFIRWILILLAIYAVTGFLILPPIIRIVVVKQLSKQLSREVSIRKVKLNPFALSATVDGLLIKEKDGRTFLSWDEVYVNFQLSSFFGRPWRFSEISVVKPFVRAEMNRDGTFNFSDLIARFSGDDAKPKPEKSANPPAVRIDEFRITGAEAALADFTTRPMFTRTVGPLNFEIKNFATESDHQNPYTFTGTTDAGERILWHGFFCLNPLSSQGDFTLDHLTLNRYAAIYQSLVKFEIRSGSIGFYTRYHLEWGATNHVLNLDGMAFALRDFRLGQPGISNDIADIPFFALTGGSVDLQNRRASVDSVVANGSKLFLQRAKNDSINVVELSKPAVTATNAPGGILFLLHSVTNAVALLLESTNQWSGTVRSVSSTHGSIHFEDRANARPVIMDLTDIRLTAKNISNLAETNFTSELSLHWNTNGTVHTETVASLRPPVFDVKVELDNLDLDPLAPYLEPELNVLLRSSRFSFHGHAHLKTPRGELPEVSFRGDTRLDDFRAASGETGEDLLRWNSVQLNGIRASLNPLSAEIKQIVVDNADVQLVVETNRTINLLNVLRRPAKTNSVTAKPASKPAPKSASVSAKNSVPAGLPPVVIDEILITNAAATFTDRSVAPATRLTVDSFNATVTGISSAGTKPVDLNLNAKVDGTGLATVTGILNPFSRQLTNSVKISVKDVDLIPVSVYAGKFAGYGIAGGKLNLDLAYAVTGENLSSKNLIVIDQFNFGDKVASPEATHLPVRLAVAILKDREGKITLDVPVEGRLDDPKFRVGKVVVYALENILEKVATSPFSLLGSMFGGGGEELGYQDFAPGGTELSDVDTKKLDSLAKALYARPALQLEISGSVDAAGDREGLQRAALNHEIRARIWAKLDDAGRATNSPDQIVLSPEERARWLKIIYNEALAAGKIPADTNLTANAASSHPVEIAKGATLLVQSAVAPAPSAPSVSVYKGKLVPPPDPQETALFATIPINESDLQMLAANRALAVKNYLVRTGKVEAARLFPAAKGQTLRNDSSRVYFQFR